jgi:hypothetical protein
MTIIKIGKCYSFDKSEFKPAGVIKRLYQDKLNLPLDKQGLELTQKVRRQFITGDEFGGYLRLERSMKHDPRLPEVQFKDAETAKTALSIAKKLDSMSKEEFLVSGYPYIWQDDIGLRNVITMDEAKVMDNKM